MSTNNPFRPGDLVVFKDPNDMLIYTKSGLRKVHDRDICQSLIRSCGKGPFFIYEIPSKQNWTVRIAPEGALCNSIHWNFFKLYDPPSAKPKMRQIKIRGKK